jgi:chorismate synthase
MRNTFGNNITVTLFGESHGPAVGAVLDGIAPGISVDTGFIRHQLDLRKPWGAVSTGRIEDDDFEILSGVFEGRTTGAPVCIVIPNKKADSSEYEKIRTTPRPGHADYTAEIKFGGYQDYRGGGHFSGRLTAALVAVGAIAISALKEKGILVGTHILRCGGVNDRKFREYKEDIIKLADTRFAVLDEERGKEMICAIEKASADGDRLGGILETAVSGLPAGVGEPWFDTLEGMLAHAVLSIPGIKGIEFGDGFRAADLRGSEFRDELCCDGGEIRTRTNHNGGVNGGISNGMPVVFRSFVKPTPSIHLPQKTVDLENGNETEITICGYHDPAIIHRCRVVADSMTALVLCDFLSINAR